MTTKPTLFALALIVCTAVLCADTRNAGAPAAPQERFLDLFSPFRTTHATLAPDGAHLAYSLRNGEGLSVVVVSMDDPTVAKTWIDVGTDRDATPMMSDNDEYTPLSILWMRWATPGRLVIMTNQSELVYGVRPLPGPDPVEGEGPRSSDDTARRDRSTANVEQAEASSPTLAWQTLSGSLFAVDTERNTVRSLVRPGDIKRHDDTPPGVPERADQGDAYLGFPYNAHGRDSISVWRELQPTVFDFAPGDDSALLLRCFYGQRHVFYRLNTATGKLTPLHEVLGEAGVLPLFDRQGRLRGGVPGAQYNKPPFRYGLEKGKLFSLGRRRPIDEITGKTARTGFWVSPENEFGERAVPIGFDENPAILYFASNIGRDTYGIYALDVTTGKQTDFALEDPTFDLIDPTLGNYAGAGALVFDRYDRTLVGVRKMARFRTTHWLRPDLAIVQAELESNLPNKNIEILEWDRARQRFLVLVHEPGSPGSFLIFETAAHRAFDVVRRAGWDSGTRTHRVFPFSIDGGDGRKVTGLLTFPRAARIANVPVVVRCATEPWMRVSTDFQPETQAYADMGFAVLQIDNRGAWGFGIKHREALKDGYERTQIDDIVLVVDQLAKQYRLNPQRIALVGEGHGGYVALRGLQLKPERFRCAASIDAPLDLGAWLENDRWTRRSTQRELSRAAYGDRPNLKAAPLVRHPDGVTKPVCMLTYPGAPGAPRTSIYLETRQFAAALRKQGTPVEFNELEKSYAAVDSELRGASADKSQLVELDREFVQRLPRSQAAVYRALESFLNAYIYDYAVRLGPLRQLPDVNLPSQPMSDAPSLPTTPSRS